MHADYREAIFLRDGRDRVKYIRQEAAYISDLFLMSIPLAHLYGQTVL